MCLVFFIHSVILSILNHLHYYKEEPHTNIKDLPKQLAKINYMLLRLLYVTIMLLYIICYYNMLYYVIMLTLIPSISHRKIDFTQ